MAENNETLGNFKIKVEVEGQQQVKTDLDNLRASFKKLQDDLKKAQGDGKKLADVLKSLKAVNINVSSGATGKTNVFTQIANEAKDAAKQLSKFETALVAAKTKAADLSRNAGRVDRAFDRLVGEVHRDATGAIIGRTGLTGATYGINQFGRMMTRHGGNLYNTFAHLVGSSTRDPVTGKWTRTGSKAMLHSFDALSKAALAAAKNLRKVGGKGGPGGPGDGGGGGATTTWVDRLIRQMKGGEKTLSGIAKLLKGANLGGLAGIGQVAGMFGTLGRLVGMFASGPVGWGLGALGVTGLGISKSMEWSGLGRNTLMKNWHRGARMSASNLNADDVNEYAKSNYLAYAQYDKEGKLDYNASFDAAHAAALAGNESFSTDLALFQTRGIEAPWMAAFANQGIDYMTIKSRKDMLSKMAEMKSLADAGRIDMNQWLTLKSEMSGTLTSEEMEMVGRGAGYFAKSTAAGKGLAAETGAESGAMKVAEEGGVDLLSKEGIKLSVEAQVQAKQTEVAYSLTSLANSIDKVTSVFEYLGAEMSEKIKSFAGDDFYRILSVMSPSTAEKIKVAAEASRKRVSQVTNPEEILRSGESTSDHIKRLNSREHPIDSVNKKTEALDTHEATKNQSSMVTPPISFQNTFQITSSDPIGVRNEIVALQREQYRQANEVMRKRMLSA